MTPKLTDLLKEKHICPSGIFSLSNLEDVLSALREHGILEVELNGGQMMRCTLWYLSAISHHSTTPFSEVQKILKDGRIDKLFGVSFV